MTSVCLRGICIERAIATRRDDSKRLDNAFDDAYVICIVILLVVSKSAFYMNTV